MIATLGAFEMAGSAQETGGEGEGHVFVSYAREDEPWARAVIGRLEKAGFAVWWDGLIPGGERFDAQIADALNSARAVVVLWSASSLKSDWVKDEAGVGRDHHRLVPLSIDGSLPPLGFRQIQSIDISRGGAKAKNAALDRVVAAVGEVLGKPFEADARGSLRIDRRKAMIAGGTAAIALGGLGAWKLLDRNAESNSVAVLPFDNLSGNAEQQYLSDGLSAELRARLSRDPDIKVVGQSSSKALAGSDDSGKAIAKKFGVANLLDGNVRSADGMVRIAVELIDGKTGFSKWSNSFDRPMTNLLQLQEDVAAAVVDALVPRLTGPGDERRTRSGGTKNAMAFDTYLRGKEAFDSHIDEASDRAALALLGKAVALDPDYAAARAARSRALAVIANQYAQMVERRKLYDDAVAEARRAIASAPDYPEGYTALGYALFYGKLDIRAADVPYQKAFQLGSGNADVLSLVALYRARRLQFDQAMTAIDRALALDPLNANVFKTRGRILYARGDYDGAIAGARRALEMNPDLAGGHGDLGNALLLQGKIDEASAAFAMEKVGLLALPGRAMVAAKKADAAAADAAFRQLVAEEGDNGLYQQAQILAMSGREQQALDALGKALAAGDSGLVYLLSDPFLASLREEPGFKTLLSRLHFV
jgi:TolB-like protein/tetratricopeptide (TPR) repeat protein